MENTSLTKIDIDKDLLHVIATSLECDISGLTSTSGLGRHSKWDSLAHISVMCALEKRYGIEITPHVVETLKTVHDIEETLINRGFI